MAFLYQKQALPIIILLLAQTLSFTFAAWLNIRSSVSVRVHSGNCILSRQFDSVTRKILSRSDTARDSSSSNTGDTTCTQPTPDLMYRDVKGVIFDIDGTLADSWKLGFDATQVILEKHGIPLITEETYHRCTRYATPDRLARHAGMTPQDEEAFIETGDRLAIEFDDLYVGLVSTETAPFYSGIAELLSCLPTRVTLGALTNAAERYGHAVFRVNCARPGMKQAIADRFKAIRGADTVPKPKPAPDGLLQVCQEMGVKPEDCVYIGDSPSDAVSAVAAGMPAIGVLWGSHTAESLRNAPFAVLCHTVEELKALLPVN